MSDKATKELQRIGKGIYENNDCELYDNGERLDLSRNLLDYVLQLSGSLAIMSEKIPSELLKDDKVVEASKKYMTDVMGSFASAVMSYLFDEDSPIHTDKYKKGGKA